MSELYRVLTLLSTIPPESSRYNFSKADTAVFTSLPSVPAKASFPHAYRWYIHVAALSGIPA